MEWSRASDCVFMTKLARAKNKFVTDTDTDGATWGMIPGKGHILWPRPALSLFLLQAAWD